MARSRHAGEADSVGLPLPIWGEGGGGGGTGISVALSTDRTPLTPPLSPAEVGYIRLRPLLRCRTRASPSSGGEREQTEVARKRRTHPSKSAPDIRDCKPPRRPHLIRHI